jgi:hypothetical protein
MSKKETVILHVYKKDGKIKVLDSQYKEEGKQLILKGWEITTGLDPCIWIEYLHNFCDNDEKIEEINTL